MRSFYNTKPFSKEKKLKNEIAYYKKYHISEYKQLSDISVEQIKLRKKDFFSERDYNKPQNIFFIKYKGELIFGRKLLSQLNIEGKIPSINCSMITSDMIFGFVANYKYKNRNIKINFYPFSDDEKVFIFNDIKDKKDLEILHPFVFLDFYTKQEVTSPSSGWKIFENTIEVLAYGEEHIREVVSKNMKCYPVSADSIIYDPACSTGTFLAELKKHIKTGYYVGQDLSKEMTDFASQYVDKVHCGNAISPYMESNTVDFMFLRFLNFRVVTTNEAKKIFKNLYKVVKPGGYLVCFGHTPVLINQEYLKKFGLEIIKCHEYSPKRNAIFQYYLMQKKEYKND